MSSRLSFEQRKFILKCYWRYGNAVEIQNWYWKEFHSDPPTWFTISQIRDMFEADGTVHDVDKNGSGRQLISASPMKQERVIKRFHSRPSPIKVLIAACDAIVSHCQQCLDHNGHQSDTCNNKISRACINTVILCII